jgi:hypothetical protein
VVTALIIRRVVREPPRGLADRLPPPTLEPFSLRAEMRELAAVARALFLRWPTANIIAGLTLSSFVSYGAYVFIPAYFNRAFGLDFATLGLVLGIAGSVPVAAGTLAGGWLTDGLGGARPAWYALVPAAGLLIATPLYLATFRQHDWHAAALLLAAAGFCQYVSLGPSFGVVQNAVGVRRRATATALLYLCLTLLALAGGPPFAGWLIDQLAGAYWVSSAGGAAQALMHAALGGQAAAAYHGACPGGSGSPACAAVLARASRAGITLLLWLYLWAAAHYALGAFGLARQLRAAAAED